MKISIKIIIPIFLFLCVTSLSAQKIKPDTDLVQFSGIVVYGDSLQPVSFTNIFIKNTRRGTVSDYRGYFSFVAQKNDTILFSAMGFKRALFIIPDTIKKRRYSMVQVMTSDTIVLPVAAIYPWPSRERFKEAFLNLDIPDDDIERAHRNLAIEEIKERAANYKMDGSMNYRNYINSQVDKLYYAGQPPPNNLLNPFAWAKFIKAWRNGDFKIKKKKK